MIPKLLPLVATTVWSATLVLSHSQVIDFVINGSFYDGYNHHIPVNPYILAAWSTQVVDDGWVGVESYRTPDIICHVNASNALGHAPIEAGTMIDIQWMGWPESHHGPVLTYMAYCGNERDSCETINKTDLEFFEIDRAGLIEPDVILSSWETAEGLWGTDMLIENNNSWVVEIPPALEAGFYVLRHELIALHYALIPGEGPQHYPQCINLHVTGNGTERPAGTPGMELYNASDPGLTYNISVAVQPPYPIPGITLWSEAVPLVKQTLSTVLRHASAIPGEPGWASISASPLSVPTSTTASLTAAYGTTSTSTSTAGST